MPANDVLTDNIDGLDFTDLSELADALTDTGEDNGLPPEDNDSDSAWDAGWDTGTFETATVDESSPADADETPSVLGVETAADTSSIGPIFGILPDPQTDLETILVAGDVRLAYPGWDGSDDVVYEDGDWDNEITDEDWWSDTGEDDTDISPEDMGIDESGTDLGDGGDVLTDPPPGDDAESGTAENDSTVTTDDDFIIIDWDLEMGGGEEDATAGTDPGTEIGPAICILIVPAVSDEIIA